MTGTADTADTLHYVPRDCRVCRALWYYGIVRLGANGIVLVGAPPPPHPRALRVPRRGGGASSPLPSAECRRRPCCVQFVCCSLLPTTGKGDGARVPPTQGAPCPAALIVAGVQAHRAGSRPFRCAPIFPPPFAKGSARREALCREPENRLHVKLCKYIFPLSSGALYREPRKLRP